LTNIVSQFLFLVRHEI